MIITINIQDNALLGTSISLYFSDLHNVCESQSLFLFQQHIHDG